MHTAKFLAPTCSSRVHEQKRFAAAESVGKMVEYYRRVDVEWAIDWFPVDYAGGKARAARLECWP